MDIVNRIRVAVWKRAHLRRENTARIDVDGTILSTTGVCKEDGRLLQRCVGLPSAARLPRQHAGAAVHHQPTWQPTLTDGAAAYLDRAIDLVRQAGFSDVLLRGDTDFTQTAHLDRWHEDGVRFVFGYDASRSSSNEQKT
ncbi:MAG: hypothetical protein R3B89_33410 [Polyangiaceae bacterium]